MALLSDYELVLPKVPDAEEFEQVYTSSDDVLQEAIVVRERAFGLIRAIENLKTSTERVGWLAIWSKAFRALNESLPAFNSSSELSLRALSRFTFECELHCLMILDPIKSLHDKTKKSEKVKITSRSQKYSVDLSIENLRAYTAWCLWSDKHYFKGILNPFRFSELWDNTIEKSILEDNYLLEKHEEFYGKLDIEINENNLKANQKKMEQTIINKIKFIDSLLSDPLLDRWVDKIDKIGKNRSISFYKLLDSKSVYNLLKKYEATFIYNRFSSDSMAIHNSTMEQFVYIDNSIVIPKTEPGNNDVQQLFSDVVSTCNRILVILGALDHYVLK